MGSAWSRRPWRIRAEPKPTSENKTKQYALRCIAYPAFSKDSHLKTLYRGSLLRIGSITKAFTSQVLAQREMIAQLAFEKLGVANIYFLKTPVLSCFATGRSTAVGGNRDGIEYLKRPDDRCHQNENQNGTQKGHGDADKLRNRTRTIHASGFIK